MRWIRYLALLTLLVLLLAVGAGVWVWRRALPQVNGSARLPALQQPVEIVRDRWGVPHIFASSDADAYRALGWAMAQDRLFQMDVLRHVSQGRLAELFGRTVLEIDSLFRTLDLAGSGRRMYAGTRPEVRTAMRAFTDGVNAYLASLGRSLPPEYAVLRTTPAPFQPDDLAGMVGFMAWQLNPSWSLDPIYEEIAAKVGPRRAAELFPQAARGLPRVPPLASGSSRARSGSAPPLQPDRFRLRPDQVALLDALPAMRASNTWALSPFRSATGHALLANDPHLGFGLPSTWYEAHLRTPQHEVIGAFLPGLPFAVIGHNRRIAWGFVNWYLDAGDFFVERIDDTQPGHVLYKGRWLPVQERHETIRIRGEAPLDLVVRSTPHGPIVNDVLPGQRQALSYRWVYNVAEDANELNGFYDLNRARDWSSFRAALSQFGAAAQLASYADVEGHIGLQATGRVPLRRGAPDGMRYRQGWTGTDEWEGFLPFARNPSEYDPGNGYVAAANNPPRESSLPYVSAYYEPEDRITRIRELLTRKERYSVEDLRRIQDDTVFLTARALAPQVVAAFARSPAPEPAVRAAVEALRGWNGDMTVESRGAAVFAVFYKHLFHEIFDDELGPQLTARLREHGNASAVMMNAVLEGGLDYWLDRQDTPGTETRAVIFRSAMRKATEELVLRMGEDAAGWQWGKLHRILFRHPLGRVFLLAPLLNEGPYALPGHAQTIDKGQFHDDSYGVHVGPSLRQITDMGDPAHALSVLPTGQSGIPASAHYADQFPIWRKGQLHPLLMDRQELESLSEGRLVLAP